MIERPILFSGEMVRAILDGWKKQTRRVVKPQPEAVHDGEPYWFIGGYRAWNYRPPSAVPLRAGGNPLPCPYGQPGDRLWVRETWKPHCEGPISPEFPLGTCVKYQADGACVKPETWSVEEGFWCEAREETTRWRPSIHMPRWASRLTLEIERVRVERVQAITEADAAAEAVTIGKIRQSAGYPAPWRGYMRDENQVEAFNRLWDSINAKRGFGWAVNPWVWAITFKRVEN